MTGEGNGVEPLVDLSRIVAGVRWRRRTWGACALAGLVAGVLAGSVLTGGSTASAQVFVVHQAEQASNSEAATKTDLALLESTTVAREAVTRAGIDAVPEDFVEEYSGEVVAANMLRITASGADDRDAVARTQALADAFVTVYLRQIDERAQAEVRVLDGQRRTLQRELADLDRDPPAAAGGGARARTDRIATLNAQLSTVEQLSVEAVVGSPRVAAGTVVIDPARVTSRPPAVSAVLVGVIGLLLGGGAGLALAAVSSVVGDRPILRRDIAAHLGASVIAQTPAPRWGPRRPRRRSRADEDTARVAAILARLIRRAPEPVSLLELGCRTAAVRLARATATELAAAGPVVLVDDLPGGGLTGGEAPADGTGTGTGTGNGTAHHTVQVVSGTHERPDRPGVRRIGVGTAAPGTSWTDLRRLGAETVLVVAAGAHEAAWLHTVARELAEEGIAVIGVVVVHPDPRDRSDGTLWDPLHTAVRGRTRRPVAPAGGTDEPARTPVAAEPAPASRPSPRPRAGSGAPAGAGTNGAAVGGAGATTPLYPVGHGDNGRSG